MFYINSDIVGLYLIANCFTIFFVKIYVEYFYSNNYILRGIITLKKYNKFNLLRITERIDVNVKDCEEFNRINWKHPLDGIK
jgi:hypothetical protein